jgi:small-conductance mechanosensitive channel
MIVLSALGLNIGPLLAGAGVIGIAIGFGAQALVRDILSGIFFLIDDAFRIGEYIEISNDLRGEVERISIRSMQLRHHRGMLLTLPFGELRSIINHNRDWAIYKQEFRVAYDTDLEKVRKIIKKLGQALMADPEYGPKLLEPLKSQGVLRIEESALIVRTKFKCKPREQFVLRRVVFERVKRAFAENGIKLAHRTVNVALPAADAEEPAPALAAAAAAAAGAVIAGDQAAKSAAGGHG